jgi:hypothetical protein
MRATDVTATTDCYTATSYLAKDVYACELPNGAVFLDLKSLQYFALGKNYAPLLAAIIFDWRSTGPRSGLPSSLISSRAELTQLLEEKGFLAPRLHNHRYYSELAQAANSCSPDWNIRATLFSALVMLMRSSVSYIIARTALRSRQLRSLLTRLSESHTSIISQRATSLPDIGALLSSFAKTRVWLYTARDQCLLDSLVLCSVLQKYGFNAHFCIGVDLQPFAAHAWVQIGALVLDDSVQHVRDFTRILVV